MRSALSLIIRILALIYIILYIHRAKSEETIKIAIIDTGYSASYAKALHIEPLKLCKTGHYDFSRDEAKIGTLRPYDYDGRGLHGTYVGGLIAKGLRDVNYCAVIYQVYTSNCGSPIDCGSSANIVKALRLATKEGLTAVNMSFYGRAANEDERLALVTLAQKGTTLFVASGNDGSNLDTKCNAFPACYKMPNQIVVGSEAKKNIRCHASNYGAIIDVYQLGTIPSDWITSGGTQCATSFATPRALSDFVSSVSHLLHGDYRLKQMPLAKTQ